MIVIYNFRATMVYGRCAIKNEFVEVFYERGTAAQEICCVSVTDRHFHCDLQLFSFSGYVDGR
jgi:hypothetical protein